MKATEEFSVIVCGTLLTQYTRILKVYIDGGNTVKTKVNLSILPG